MMKKVLACVLALLFALVGCAPAAETPSAAPETPPVETAPIFAPLTPAAPRDPAEVLLDTMTTGEKVGQLFFARYPETGLAEEIAAYQPAGYILFSRDFEGQTPDSIRAELAAAQEASAIPLLLGVDEEGGTVVRASRHEAFRTEKFRAPQKIYDEGGLDAVLADTAEKDAFLLDLGLNVNLAPVADVSEDEADFIHARALGRDAEETAGYVAAVVRQMSGDGIGSVLKHFPGYGDNVDTHTGIAVDERSLDSFRTRDFLPFAAGTRAGAGAVLVSHNIVKCMDEQNPASLSPAVYAVLRDELGFEGVAMTDDLAMDAVGQYTDGASAAVLAVQAGSDLLISSDLASQYGAVLAAVQSGGISAERLDEAVLRVLRWKKELGLLQP